MCVTAVDSSKIYLCFFYLILCLAKLLLAMTQAVSYMQFLGAFAKLQKEIISFIMSVRLSACNNSAPTRRIFMKFDISEFFETVEKFQVSLNSDKNNGTLHEDLCTFMISR